MKVSSSIPKFIGGLVGASLWMTASIGWAQTAEREMRLAQQVVDGLPPPPVVFGQETLPVLPPSQPSFPQPQTAPASAQRYLVIVNGDSPLLLSQVQSVAPGASVQEYNGQRFIQAGIFDNPTQAQQQVVALTSQGIGADVFPVNGVAAAPASVPSSPTSQAALPPPDLLPVAAVPREVEFGQPPTSDQLSNPVPLEEEFAAVLDASSYFIVIPSNSGNVDAVSNQVTRLGDGVGIAGMVQVDDSPRGTHVRVGPFVDRGAASRWTRYFREFGLNARVYYQR